MHQGTKVIPADFIASAQSHHEFPEHHSKLLCNFFAQTKALAFGKKQSFDQNQDDYIFKSFDGNRPTNSIMLKKFTPRALGSLIAMYEHKIFVQGIVLNIFSFDQWGVELGKKVASEILSKLDTQENITCYDSSTNGQINFYKS